MLKDMREDRMTTHYYGPDFDAMKSKLKREQDTVNKLMAERAQLKSLLCVKLSDSIKDESTMNSVFVVLNEVLP